ncbi:MAG TPA: LCP family protein [Gaiellaceae bacterium]|jgi:LCP family protein required for cell wall assembly|nr:LCP family protein [Gaiellaceae bacterium]
MAREEKPYRVYRGGRQKGKVPVVRSRSSRVRPGSSTDSARSEYRGPGGGAPKRRRWGRYVALGLLVLVVFFVLWAVLGYLSVSKGVSDANRRLDPNAKAALTTQGGLLSTHSTTILMLGTDNADVVGRTGDMHSDSIMLLRTDPSHHRLYYLSIPRDLQVPIAGIGTQKINAAYQAGGAALAIKTIHQFTGLQINHVVIVNFAAFKDMIDAIGGIDIDVPKPIHSNSFDCPYTAAKCATWTGWRFAKGKQHMNGQRALVYSRIRENQLDPAENDITRGARQQAVMDAVTAKLASVGTFFRMPFSGSSFVKPLTTDLSTMQLLELGWVKFRSSNSSAVHCRLGGDLGGGGNGSPSEDNPTALAMFLGKSAPQPPTDPFGPGCVIGHTLQ